MSQRSIKTTTEPMLVDSLSRSFDDYVLALFSDEKRQEVVEMVEGKLQDLVGIYMPNHIRRNVVHEAEQDTASVVFLILFDRTQLHAIGNFTQYNNMYIALRDIFGSDVVRDFDVEKDSTQGFSISGKPANLFISLLATVRDINIYPCEAVKTPPPQLFRGIPKQPSVYGR